MEQLGKGLLSFINDYIKSQEPVEVSDKKYFMRALLKIKQAQDIILDSLIKLHPIVTENIYFRKPMFTNPQLRHPLPPVNPFKTKAVSDQAQRILDNFSDIRSTMDGIKSKFSNFRDLEVAISSQDIKEYLQDNELRDAGNENLTGFLTEMAAYEPPVFMDIRDISHESWHEHVEIEKILKKESEKLQQKFNKLESHYFYKNNWIKNKTGMHIKMMEKQYDALRDESRLELERALMELNEELSYQHEQKLIEEKIINSNQEDFRVEDLPSAIIQLKKLSATKRIIEKKLAITEKTVRNLENKVKVVSEFNKELKKTNRNALQDIQNLSNLTVWLAENSKLKDASKQKVKKAVDRKEFSKLLDKIAEDKLEISAVQEFLLKKLQEIREKINVIALGCSDRNVSAKLLELLEEFKIDSMLEESEKQSFKAFTTEESPKTPSTKKLSYSKTILPKGSKSPVPPRPHRGTVRVPSFAPITDYLKDDIKEIESDDSLEESKSFHDDLQQEIDKEIAAEMKKLKSLEVQQEKKKSTTVESLKIPTKNQLSNKSMKSNNSIKTSRKDLRSETSKVSIFSENKDDDGISDNSEVYHLRKSYTSIRSSDKEEIEDLHTKTNEFEEIKHEPKEIMSHTKDKIEKKQRQEGKSNIKNIKNEPARVETQETNNKLKETVHKKQEIESNATNEPKNQPSYNTSPKIDLRIRETLTQEQLETQEKKPTFITNKNEIELSSVSEKITETKLEPQRSEHMDESTRRTYQQDSKIDLTMTSQYTNRSQESRPEDLNYHAKHHSVITRLQTPPELGFFRESLLSVLAAFTPKEIYSKSLKEILQFKLRSFPVQSLILKLLKEHLDEEFYIKRKSERKSTISVNQVKQISKGKKKHSETPDPVQISAQTAALLKKEFDNEKLKSPYDSLSVWKSVANKHIDEEDNEISQHLRKYTGTPAFDTQLQNIVDIIEKKEDDAPAVAYKLFEPSFMISKRLTAKTLAKWTKLTNGLFRRNAHKLGHGKAVLPHLVTEIWYQMAKSAKYIRHRLTRSRPFRQPPRQNLKYSIDEKWKLTTHRPENRYTSQNSSSMTPQPIRGNQKIDTLVVAPQLLRNTVKLPNL